MHTLHYVLTVMTITVLLYKNLDAHRKIHAVTYVSNPQPI